MTLHPIPLNYLINEENFLFFFISVGVVHVRVQSCVRTADICISASKKTLIYEIDMGGGSYACELAGGISENHSEGQLPIL